MCGILGGNNKMWNYVDGISCMRHRGPDDVRVKHMDDFVLAFSRLSIIDLTSNGMQPMFDRGQDVGIVYNGEIYGYQKLRGQLIRRGHIFQSDSDTEVILNAYLEWGDKFIDRIDGMFGMAIYDKRQKKIKLYRDRMGIKPLYFYCDGSDFGFSSELKGIEKMCRGKTLVKDNTAIYDYLTYGYVPEPKTYYKNVFKLEPAHMLIYDLNTNRIEKKGSYWKLRTNGTRERKRDQRELMEETKSLIQEAVREQMISDVPVGTFLSGGVDSSIITYECSKINADINSFSIGFRDKTCDETKFADILADRYFLNNQIEYFDYAMLRKNYNKMKTWYDEPFADTSAFPTYLVSDMAKKRVGVVLTGDGGDEVFGGYEKYQFILKKDRECGPDNYLCSNIYQLVKRRILKKKRYLWDYYFLDDLSLYTLYTSGETKASDAAVRKKLGIDQEYDRYWHVRKYYHKELPPITRWQYLDLKTYLPGDILTKVDRASMAVSLEARVPLLSTKIVEFAFSLSEEDRCPLGVLKGLLKKAYRDEIGEEIAYRKKQGFAIPYSYNEVRDSVKEDMLANLFGF